MAPPLAFAACQSLVSYRLSSWVSFCLSLCSTEAQIPEIVVKIIIVIFVFQHRQNNNNNNNDNNNYNENNNLPVAWASDACTRNAHQSAKDIKTQYNMKLMWGGMSVSEGVGEQAEVAGEHH